jgi:hypothetical protein
MLMMRLAEPRGSRRTRPNVNRASRPSHVEAHRSRSGHRRAVLRFRSPNGRRPDLDTPGRLASCRLAHPCKAAALHGASVVTVKHEIRRPTLGVVVRPFDSRLLWPRLTSGGASGDLSITVANVGTPPDLPGYCAPSVTLMRVGSTSLRSGHVPGFTDLCLLTPQRRLYPLPVRRASALPAASFRRSVTQDALAVPLTVPRVGPVEDFHLQEGAPCRAHK